MDMSLDGRGISNAEPGTPWTLRGTQMRKAKAGVRGTHSSAVSGGGRADHPPSTSCKYQELGVGNLAPALDNSSGKAPQVGDLAYSMTKTHGRVKYDNGHLDVWRKAARAVDGFQLSGFTAPIQPAKGTTQDGENVVGDIHQRIKTSAAGVDVRSVRQTRTGGVLLGLKKTTADIRASFAETLRKEGEETSSITELVPKATLEIRDCDCCTSSIEVEEVLKRNLPGYAGKIEIKMTNPNTREQRLTILKIVEEAVAKLLKAGRVLVGFVSCRVRRREELRRCFRCLDYGHYSDSCDGPDRNKSCYSCGGMGYKIKGCKVSEPTCFLCSNGIVETRKHQAGSKPCKAFQETLATPKN
ncbi:uncharacterized protein LOC118443129 [Vespa mandarinia]|uniref:uncharacterized protein LOC118443129 n=1 Tax=Vespa mandarinia TaxID=7446 RepID=UPI00160DE55B|nr:uncharacterized protein LOC118443129 [Vespa mandarinia]